MKTSVFLIAIPLLIGNAANAFGFNGQCSLTSIDSNHRWTGDLLKNDDILLSTGQTTSFETADGTYLASLNMVSNEKLSIVIYRKGEVVLTQLNTYGAQESIRTKQILNDDGSGLAIWCEQYSD